MNRSRRCLFVAHCLLAQGIVAEGRARFSRAAVRPIVQFCLDNDINIFQMPCPEVLCPAGGIGRDMHGKKWYEEHGLRKTCSRIAKEQARYMEELTAGGFEVLAVLGVEFSPACAANYLNRGRAIVKEKGMYVEELERELKSHGLKIPFIGVNERWGRKLEKELEKVLK